MADRDRFVLLELPCHFQEPQQLKNCNLLRNQFGFADGADADEDCLTDGFGLAFDLDKNGLGVETFAVLIRSEIDGTVRDEDDAPNGS